MRLEGSCQCGKVRFRVDSATPYPYMYCYCSICRKTAGGPYGCNLMGKRATLKTFGEKHLRRYHAAIRADGRRAVRSEAERWFCGVCGSHLFVLDDRWPEGVWPNAAAIDTPLLRPPELVHIMLRYKPSWVQVSGPGPRCREYPRLSIAAWHEQHGLMSVEGGRPQRPGRRRARRAGSSASSARQRARRVS